MLALTLLWPIVAHSAAAPAPPEAKLPTTQAEEQDAVKFAEESPDPEPSILEPTTYDGPFAA